MIDAPLLLDTLLVATIGGTLLLLAALAFARLRHSSGDLRHQVVGHALIAGVGIFALTIWLRPGPIGCLTASCEMDRARADRAARVQQYHTAAAAGKFADLAPRAKDADDGTSARTGPFEGTGLVAAVGAAPADGRAGRGVGGDVSSARVVGIVLLWFAGLAFSLARIIRRRWLAARFVRAARPVGRPELATRFRELTRRSGFGGGGDTDGDNGIRLLEHPTLAAPVVAGTLRPALLLPVGFEVGPEADIVFLHELAHLRRRDPLVTLLGELAAACFWFNPVVRLAARRMRELQELAADNHVLREGIRPSRYARYLVDAFRELTHAGGVHLPNSHSIVGDCLMETRVRTILDPRAAHGLPSRPLTAVIAFGFALVCGALAWAPAALQARGVLTQQTRPAEGLERSLLNAATLDSIVRPIFIDHMADRYIAGAAISIVHDGRIVYEGGFGRREVFHEIPVDPDRTIWRIGSITKVLTGVAVMQLVDRGLLDLDAPVNDYLTGFQIPDTYDEPVRVRHLLTHTAGFDQIGLERHVSSREEVRPLSEFLEQYLGRIRPPDVISTYDTYGITLAGYLVEKVSGLSYEDYLKRHILEPLDMHRSGILVPPALEGDVATGYGFAGHWEAARWEFMNTDPASTVNSTVTEMARFAIMLLEDGRYDGRRVLSEASARAMLTRQWTNHPDQPGYGYTFWEDRSYGIPAFSHGGSMEGYGSLLYLVPEHDLGVFIAYNQESGSLPNVVLTGLVDALFPGRPDGPELRPRLTEAVDVSRFTGTYANSMHHHTNPAEGWRRQPFELEVDAEGRLVFQGEPAFPVGPLAFQRDDGLLITFRENERGEIVYMFVNQTVYEKLD